MAIRGIDAANKLLSFKNIRSGYCLYYVWQAYKAIGASTNKSAATALIGWINSSGKHAGDRNPPVGVPVWFGARPGSDAGDVVISIGNGKVVCTDWPTGKVGITTIDQRQKQIGRPYLGWTETILGVPISYYYATPPTGSPATVTPSATVKNIQQALNTLGYGLVVDGVQGAKTVNAIKAFQRRYGLVADGVWGPKTNTMYNSIVVARRPVIKQGSVGSYVQLVQRKLGLKQDGQFGPKTKAAVVKFQKSKRLVADGIVGPKTWSALGY